MKEVIAIAIAGLLCVELGVFWAKTQMQDYREARLEECRDKHSVNECLWTYLPMNATYRWEEDY